MSAQQLITEHIDLWTSTIKARNTQGRGSSKKRELYGIKKLRELILELAVRGKLAPQDPRDEPASELLKRIAAEKAQLIKDKKIKKQKPLPIITKEEKPFELPTGWEWIRLGTLYEMKYGNSLPKTRRSETGEYPVYGSNGVVGSHNECCINEPCIVIGRKGSAGALNLCSRNGCWVTDVAYSVVPPKSLDLNFVFKSFHTLGLDTLGKGIKPGLNRNEAYILALAIPPLKEQHRIVAKVDELMALCDQLEQQTESSLDAHNLLVDILLATLTDARDAKVLSDNWTRLADHFDTLITTDYAVEKLKQTILQLAVQGKLVPQDPNDEPASELLKRIAAEKEQLIKEKIIKKQKKLTNWDELDLPFNIRFDWSWIRLGEICHTVADGPHFSPKYVEKQDGITFISARNISKNKIDLSTAKYVSKEDHQLFCKRVKIKKGDILYTKGGTTGVAKVNDLDLDFSVWVHVAVLQIPPDKVHNEYIALALNSPHCYKQSQKYTHGIGNKDLGLTRMINITIPLPPLNMQHRIVSKVDELMTLCDQFKAQLNNAQTTQLHLSDAVVDNALVV